MIVFNPNTVFNMKPRSLSIRTACRRRHQTVSGNNWSKVLFRTHSTHSHSHSHSHGHHHGEGDIEGARAYCRELLRYAISFHYYRNTITDRLPPHQLRTSDYPSYILQTFIPPSARDANLAIRAFNIDVARVADQVSNTTVGKIRLQFFRDAIDRCYTGHAPKEPVLTLISKVLHDGTPLSKSFWSKIISAREQYLGNVTFTTLAALESYAESTYSSLQYLSLESMHYRSTDLDHVASHIGKAAGITAVLRGTPLMAAPGPNSLSAAVLLPVDICAQHGLRQEDVIRRGGEAEGLKDVIFTIATRANDHLITAREMLEKASDEGKGPAFSTFLPAVSCSLSV